MRPNWAPSASSFFAHAYWDLETTKTTFNNNFILRASLEQSDGKTSGWWFGVVVLATKNAKGATNGERGMGNGVDLNFNTERQRGREAEVR